MYIVHTYTIQTQIVYILHPCTKLLAFLSDIDTQTRTLAQVHRQSIGKAYGYIIYIVCYMDMLYTQAHAQVGTKTQVVFQGLVLEGKV